jgi:5'-3' exonuclease
MKYLLIDGNNLAIRAAFGNKELANREGVSSGVHYGTMQSLIGLKQKFPEYKMMVAWDGRSARRVKEAGDGAEKGLVKSGYKENRPRGEELPQEIKDFKDQSTVLKLAIDKLGINQIRIATMEADDVIASYCHTLKEAGHEIICVTTDKDYFQLLDEKISIWNGMKDEMMTKQIWVNKNKIEPHKHVDVGAFSGDTGDNIFGVPGWGEKTALKAIQKHNGWKEVLKYLHDKYDSVRESFPDVSGSDFDKLSNICTPKEQEKKDADKEWKGKYPDVRVWMPFTGVALALEEKKWKPKITSGVKNEVMALIFEERVNLAYSLKGMDDDIPDLPELFDGISCIDDVIDYFDYFDIESLKEQVHIFKEK